jgi:hypothetical protein
MGLNVLVLRGELAQHPAAARFAAEVRRIHGRYADEVVARYRLCPFLRDAESGFGSFCVLLDREPVLETALAAVREAETSVVHLVFPCIRTPALQFERFSARLGEQLRLTCDPSPVMASFHPEMAGDDTNYHRLVGLLRHAPDPFVQTVPEGLNQGGTVLAGAGVDPGVDRPRTTSRGCTARASWRSRRSSPRSSRIATRATRRTSRRSGSRGAGAGSSTDVEELAT